jgi:mono/diheme cytochrome c family protein
MRNRFQAAMILSVLSVPISLAAPTPDDIQPGRTIFEHQCSPCHARAIDEDGSAILSADGYPVLAGAASLAIKYKGTTISPYIEERSDLANSAVLRVFLRNGSPSMPPFRKSELPDSSIEALAAYFLVTAKVAQNKQREQK